MNTGDPWKFDGSNSETSVGYKMTEEMGAGETGGASIRAFKTQFFKTKNGPSESGGFFI